MVRGVSAFTYQSTQPLSVFDNQQLAGFYRNNAWSTSLGIPIFDYGTSNSAFKIATTNAPIDPALIYDPKQPFLNGGALPNVLAKFAGAKYVLSRIGCRP